MRILTQTQGTAEWLSVRCGRITASRMDDVLSFLKRGDKKGTESAARASYKAELVSERLTGRASEHYVSGFMDFGSEYEAEARRSYELRTEVMVDQTGFVLHPSLDFAGASPDGLVGSDGGLEIKVPKTETHIGYLFDGEVPEIYKPQMFWNMACCEREWWDFCSYSPALPSHLKVFIKRLQRDEAIIHEMTLAAIQFHGEVEGIISALNLKSGKLADWRPEPRPMLTSREDADTWSERESSAMMQADIEDVENELKGKAL